MDSNVANFMKTVVSWGQNTDSKSQQNKNNKNKQKTMLANFTCEFLCKKS